MLSIKRFICCGMDVHKKFVVTSIAFTDYRGVTTYKKKRFATFNSDLKSLKEWLLSNNCTEACMESTGKYLIPIFNILEDSCHVVIANPKYVRAIKGQKTDDKDSTGITEKSATFIIAEIGVDMTVFKSSKHLCSWAGLTPQNNESAGKKKSVHISRAGIYLKPLLVQCANAAIKDKKNPYFKYKFDRIKKRCGHKRTIIAITRIILTCIYSMFQKQEVFNPADTDYSAIPEEMYENFRNNMIRMQ